MLHIPPCPTTSVSPLLFKPSHLSVLPWGHMAKVKIIFKKYLNYQRTVLKKSTKYSQQTWQDKRINGTISSNHWHLASAKWNCSLSVLEKKELFSAPPFYSIVFPFCKKVKTIYLFVLNRMSCLIGRDGLWSMIVYTLCHPPPPHPLPPLSPFEPGDCSLLADQGKVLLGGGGSNDKSLKIFHKGLGGDDLCRILKQRTCQWVKVQIRLI